MKYIRFALAALAVAALSACYISETALVGEDAATPFENIAFTGRDGDSKPVAFSRDDGNGYVTESDDGEQIFLHLKSVEGDYYVAQLSGTGDDGEPEFLYGYLRIDMAAKVADAWRIVGTSADERPGLRVCDEVICIDDLNAYVAYAKEAIAAGQPPDTSFDIVVE